MSEYKRIKIDGERYYGQHFMVSAAQCTEDLRDIDTIKKFLTTLVEDIDMVAYGDPFVARFGGGIEVGISGVQLIETSAISLHTNDGELDLYLDVFSCKEFDINKVINCIDSFFLPQTIDEDLVYRR
jgi:S-adenosylmethionine/arginine decarboxylase-like enzyme